jgi:glycine oxidase
MTEVHDVAIVGGGVVGLSIAYALARAGLCPAVLDRRELGREASWAGAGLIPPDVEGSADRPPSGLRSFSAGLYPGWATELEQETAIDVGYRRTGGVDVAFTESEDQVLRAAAGRWRAEGIACERLAPADVCRIEPELNRDARAVYFLPDRAQVRNPRLLRALIAAISRRGCRLEPWRGVTGFEIHQGRVRSLRTTAGKLNCGAVIVAAGAWSGDLLEPIGVHAPTPPVKGQIVLLRSDRPLLRRIVEHGPNYLVPRDDGRVLVGATEENVGFDTRTTSQGVRDLLDHALHLCPILREAEVETAWAGLRPGSIDARPYIGRAPELENVIVATGHKRAGLQLAPGTALLVEDLLLGRPPRLDLSPYRIDRPPDMAADEPFRS